MRTRAILMLAALAAWTLGAAPAVTAQAQIKNNFPRPPAAAVTALNKTVGKPFNAGYVFIDGKYLKPPYTVERYGTVVRINGCQVTSEIVPWEEFIKTQEGAVATKTEVPASGGDDLFGDDGAAEPEPEVEEEEEDDLSSLDDLFDDDPKPKKASKPAKKKSWRPKPRKPTAVVTYSFEGTFTPNERSKALVAKINAMRTRIDSQLRAGGYFFFSSRYSNLSGDAGSAKRVIAKLPEVMKRYSDREAFGTACRQSGMSHFPVTLMDDLHRNRLDYIQLEERRKADQAKNEWQKLLME